MCVGCIQQPQTPLRSLLRISTVRLDSRHQSVGNQSDPGIFPRVTTVLQILGLCSDPILSKLICMVSKAPNPQSEMVS